MERRGRKLTRAQREEHLSEVAHLRAAHKQPSEIARLRDCSVDQIYLDLQLLRKRLLAREHKDVDFLRNEELMRIEAIEVEAWRAWWRSQEPEETTISGRSTTEDETTERASLTRRQRVGDARFLDTIYKCVDKRCELLGLDAPIKVDLTAEVVAIAQAEGITEARAMELAHEILALEEHK